MNAYDLIVIVTTLTALLAFLNERFLKLPAAIGSMMLALVLKVTFLVVVFSIPVQGLTVGKLITASVPKSDNDGSAAGTSASH